MEDTGCEVVAVSRIRNPRAIACERPYLILTAMEWLLDDEVEYIIVLGGDEPPAVIWFEEQGFIPGQYPNWLRSTLQHRLSSTGSLEAIAPFPGEGLDDSDDDNGGDDSDDDSPDPSVVVDSLLDESTLCGR